MGDRELPGRDGGEQVEQAVERRLVARLDRREEEDLGVDPVERGLELLLVPHFDGAVEAELERLFVQGLEAAGLVLECAAHQHPRVGDAARPPAGHRGASVDHYDASQRIES